MLKSVTRNTRGRDFIAGDLHGMYSALLAELERVGFSAQDGDRLFCVGDLIDRGPDSMACLELIYEPWFFTVTGNHEQMMLSALASDASSQSLALWVANGGNWALNCATRRLREAMEYASAHLPLALEIETDPMGTTVGIIHSDVTSLVWGRFDHEADVWSRRRSRHGDGQPVDSITGVICGHTPIPAPALDANVLNIDTGACFEGGHLTLFALEDLVRLFRDPVRHHQALGIEMRTNHAVNYPPPGF